MILTRLLCMSALQAKATKRGKLPAPGRLKARDIDLNLLATMTASGEHEGGLWWSAALPAGARRAWARVNRNTLSTRLLSAPLAGQPRVTLYVKAGCVVGVRGPSEQVDAEAAS